MDKRTGSTGSVGDQERRKTVVIPKDNPHGAIHERHSPAMLAALNWGQRHGWEIIDLFNWRNEIPEGVHPDGILVDHPGKQVRLQQWYEQVPVGVMIDPAPYVTGPYAIISQNSAMAGYKAADYFRERGFRNFAICHYGQPDLFIALVEFEERIKEAGGTCASILCNDESQEGTLAAIARSTKRQLSALPLPLALFCVNDLVAVRVCRWCREMGLSVPEQVAILGLGNDVRSCTFNPVPLSSIDLVPEQRGVEAARLLARMMQGAPAPKDPIKVPVGNVVTRRSTDILAVSDVDVARALRYIWDHYREDIGLDEIAAAVNVSRSKLSRHLKAAVGRTVTQELTRVRLKKACELLTTSDRSVIDIAAMTGYRSPQYFNAQFGRAFDLSPQRYRKRERENRSAQ